jgi:hypothetical protein
MRSSEIHYSESLLQDGLDSNVPKDKFDEGDDMRSSS